MLTLPHITAESILQWSAVIGVVAGIFGWYRKRVRPALRKLRIIGEDWVGVPDRPGVKGRPGVMQRIDDIEKIAQEARYHSMPNGGNSAYDKLTQKLDQNRDDVGQVQSDVSALIGTMAQHTNELVAFGQRMDASERDRESIHREISVFKFGGTERQQS